MESRSKEAIKYLNAGDFKEASRLCWLELESNNFRDIDNFCKLLLDPRLKYDPQYKLENFKPQLLFDALKKNIKNSEIIFSGISKITFLGAYIASDESEHIFAEFVKNLATEFAQQELTINTVINFLTLLEPKWGFIYGAELYQKIIGDPIENLMMIINILGDKGMAFSNYLISKNLINVKEFASLLVKENKAGLNIYDDLQPIFAIGLYNSGRYFEAQCLVVSLLNSEIKIDKPILSEFFYMAISGNFKADKNLYAERLFKINSNNDYLFQCICPSSFLGRMLWRVDETSIFGSIKVTILNRLEDLARTCLYSKLPIKDILNDLKLSDATREILHRDQIVLISQYEHNKNLRAFLREAFIEGVRRENKVDPSIDKSL